MASAMPPITRKSMAEVTILCPICRKANPRNDQNIRRAHFCQHCGHDIVLNNPGPRFYITRVIKEGGQGAVYEVVGEDWSTYAVKEMLDRFGDPKERAEATERFKSEADLLRSLRNPRVPRVYADFEDEGRHYLVMEFVRGEDLEQIVERDGAIPEAQLLEWADQICDVLEVIHDRGLVYRDMKPSNVMLDQQNGGIKLVDFGIAKVFQRAERGTQIGTPGYAPPEQYQGLASVESDVYALGATLHHLLTGRDPRDEAPFSFPPVRQLKSNVSTRTAEAITRALEMKPEDRFHSVAAFRAALRPLPAPAQQVRRAQPAAQPAAQVAAQPAPAQAARRPAAAPIAPPPAAQSVPSVSNVPARKKPKPQTQPIQPVQPGFFRRATRFIIRLFMTVVVLLVVAVVAVYFLAPSLIVEYVPNVAQYVPGLFTGSTPATPSQATPSNVVLTTQPYTAADLEVTAAAGKDVTDPELRAAFFAAYAARAKQELGEATIVNPNAPPSLQGNVETVRTEADGSVVYRATVTGFVQAP